MIRVSLTKVFATAGHISLRFGTCYGKQCCKKGGAPPFSGPGKVDVNILNGFVSVLDKQRHREKQKNPIAQILLSLQKSSQP